MQVHVYSYIHTYIYIYLYRYVGAYIDMCAYVHVYMYICDNSILSTLTQNKDATNNNRTLWVRR